MGRERCYQDHSSKALVKRREREILEKLDRPTKSSLETCAVVLKDIH